MQSDFVGEVRSFVVVNYLLGRQDGLSDDDSFQEQGIIDSTGILELVSQTAGVPDENVSIFSFQGLRPTLLCGGNCRATDGGVADNIQLGSIRSAHLHFPCRYYSRVRCRVSSTLPGNVQALLVWG